MLPPPPPPPRLSYLTVSQLSVLETDVMSFCLPYHPTPNRYSEHHSKIKGFIELVHKSFQILSNLLNNSLYSNFDCE